MSVLYLTEADVTDLIDMPATLGVVEEAFRQFAAGKATNIPRARAFAPGVALHTLSASAEYLGLIGWKAYTTTRASMRFHVAAYDIQSGAMRALIEANWLGQLRTGAATGVAAKYMARPDADSVGIFGSGLQAQTQVMAVCAAKRIRRVEVFSRDPERRASFASKLSGVCAVEVVPVENPQQAASNKGIVITASTSKVPVFDGRDLAEGTLVCAVGSNYLVKTEIDVETVRRAKTIVCDSKEQCRLEAGDFVAALANGTTTWDAMHELADVVSGKTPGRSSASEINLFKSVGLALEDVAMAGELIRRAESAGRGQQLPIG